MQLRAERALALKRVVLAQKVLLSVEIAVFRVGKTAGPHGGPLFKRRKRGRAPGRRAGRDPPPRPVWEDLESLGELAVAEEFHFPVWEGGRLKCIRCQRSADAAHITAFVKGGCPRGGRQGPFRQWERTRVHHQLVDGASPACSRCGGEVPERRRAFFAAARCFVWRVGCPGDPIQQDCVGKSLMRFPARRFGRQGGLVGSWFGGPLLR